MMTEFTRPDPTATCDTRHLAHLLNVDAVDVDKGRVLVYGTPPSNAQTIINAYVYDPNWNKPAEELTLKEEISVRLQSLDDATKTSTAWNALTAAQRQETTRLAIQGFVKVVRFLAKRFL